MRLDQQAVRLTDGAVGRALDYQPISDLVTIAWPEGVATHPGSEARWLQERAVEIQVPGHGPGYNLPARAWGVEHHTDGEHAEGWACHDRLHWHIGDAHDATTARQIWADRHHVNRILLRAGGYDRPVRLQVRYGEDHAAVFENGRFLGAFGYPPGSRHRWMRRDRLPRHRPPAGLPDGARLYLADLPVGAVLTPPPHLPGRSHAHELIVTRRHGPHHPELRARTWVSLGYLTVPVADAQRCDPSTAVVVRHRAYTLDHWPDPAPGR